MDSHSDLEEEELPVFDFLRPDRHLSRTSNNSPGRADPAVDLTNSDAENRDGSSPAEEKQKKTKHRRAKDALLTIISSSDSDDDAPYVPLAQRLKQRQDYGKDVEPKCPSSLHVTDQNTPPLGSRQVSVGASDAPGETAPPPRPWTSLKPPDTLLPAQRKPAAKRTAEEIQAARQEALRRREAKAPLEQERQKAERKALAEAAKALRPEECIKRMVVAVDPALLQLEGGGTLLASVQALGCSCAIEKQALPRSVSWMRRTPSAQSADGVCVPEAQVVMHMTVDDFTSLIHSYVQTEKHGRSDSGPTLTQWVKEQQRRNHGKVLSLVLIDMETYFRGQKSQKQKKFREAVTNKEQVGGQAKKRKVKGGEDGRPQLSRVEVEEAVVHLQLHTGVPVRFLASWKEFSDHVTMTTKAVAEAPFKQEREKTGFSFHLESEWAGGQRVDKGGKGLLQVWRRQIQQLNRVSADMAAAVLAAYPSPQLLRKAYGLCQTDAERNSLLSDLLIRRGEGVTSTARRVGPELSKRLFITMSSCDPEQTLDSTV